MQQGCIDFTRKWLVRCPIFLVFSFSPEEIEIDRRVLSRRSRRALWLLLGTYRLGFPFDRPPLWPTDPELGLGAAQLAQGSVFPASPPPARLSLLFLHTLCLFLFLFPFLSQQSSVLLSFIPLQEHFEMFVPCSGIHDHQTIRSVREQVIVDWSHHSTQWTLRMGARAL